MEWVRERVLKLQSHRLIQSQNRESLAFSQDPLAQAMGMFTAALKDGDHALAAIWFDRLQVLHLQRQVEGHSAMRELLMSAHGGAAGSGTGSASSNLPALAALLGRGGSAGRGSTLFNPNPPGAARAFNHTLNPANGAIPFAQAAGVGNAPSPDAGAFSGGERNTGLSGPEGEPLQR
jgi:hypothetical protein